METTNINEQKSTKQVYLTEEEKRNGWAVYDGWKYRPDGLGYELFTPEPYDENVRPEIEHLEIPRTVNGKPVVSLGEFLFNRCLYPSLKKITIPDSVENIILGYGYLAGRSDISISIDPNNPNYVMVGNNLCSKDGKTLFAHIRENKYVEGKEEFFNVPDGITALESSCCAGYSGIVIPLSVDYIKPFNSTSSVYANVYYKGTKREWKKIRLHESVKR